MLASASYDDTINIYLDDPDDDWYPTATLRGHTSTVWCLAWSPCGEYLVSCSDDLTVRIWVRVRESAGGQRWDCIKILKEHDRAVYSITWGAGLGGEGSLGWIASAAGDGKINVWDIRVCVLLIHILEIALIFFVHRAITKISMQNT